MSAPSHCRAPDPGRPGCPGRRGQPRRRPVKTKAELVAALADGTGATKKDVEAILNNLPIALRSTVKAGTPFTLPGIGIFKAKALPARKARNPSTGAMIDVPAKTKLAFKPAKSMSDAVA
ncbi:MAG: DNA-binding protein [Rhodocyclaceae bacterium]|nr:DNA-binding protein [Rhodocyclaceae bacterium]